MSADRDWGRLFRNGLAFGAPCRAVGGPVARRSTLLAADSVALLSATLAYMTARRRTCCWNPAPRPPTGSARLIRPPEEPAPGGWHDSLARNRTQIAAARCVPLLTVLDRLRASAERLEAEQGVAAGEAEVTTDRRSRLPPTRARKSMASSGFTSKTAGRMCCAIPVTPRPGAGGRCADVACRPTWQRQRFRASCLRDGRRPGSGMSRQPPAQPGPAPARGAVHDRDGQRAPTADQHDEALAASHARVEQVAREHGGVLRRERGGFLGQAGDGW